VTDGVAADMVRSLPTGTVTFLRTDVEGSMRLVRELGAAWDVLNDEHLRLVRSAVDATGGVIVRTEGDAVFAAFPEARAAVAAAIDAQRALSAYPWPDGRDMRVRTGLHSGEAHLAGDDYGGFEVNRAARIAATGHGGQIVISAPTYELVADDLPAGVEARDLGSYVLRDISRPERLYQLDVPDLPTTFPPLRAGRTVVGNLEERSTTFVGREHQVDEVRALVEAARLVTLTGPGGSGKTSLAVEVARSIQPSFADGAWLVPLATIESPDDVLPLVARTIGLLDGSSRSAVETLTGFLADRSMLLILDNFEHVVSAAPAVSDLLRDSPSSRVIATSRAPLHLTGEQSYPVQPLVVGDAARLLFVDRARAVRPSFEPGDEAQAIDDICRLVDGLPLGIELAAARVGLLSPAVIRDRLAEHRPLPGPGRRDAPERQRTLEAAVGWSHGLLDASQQALLATLSIFEDGFDPEEVDAVADDDAATVDRLDDLLSLADQNLIVATPDAGDRPRFAMLGTIQTYALGRLRETGREADARQRHARAYLALLRVAEPHLNTSRHAEWLVRVTRESANLRAATRWAIDSGEAELALGLVGHQWRFWHANGQLVEGRGLTEAALAMPNAPMHGSTRAWAVAAAGSIAYWQFDTDAARRYYEQQVELAKGADDERCLADALFNLGHVLFIERADDSDVLAYMEDVIRRYRDLGDERGVTRATWTRGIVAMDAGRLEEAETYLREGLADFDRLDDPQYQAMSAASLGWIRFALGDVTEAARFFVRALLATHAMRDIGTTTISLHVGIVMANMTERFEDGAVIAGAFDALCERYGVRPPAGLDRFLRLEDSFKTLAASLDSEAFEAAYDRGRRLSLGEAVDLVVDMGNQVAEGA
jgi:predicted ATPase/class 3 adenylate cyclase